MLCISLRSGSVTKCPDVVVELVYRRQFVSRLGIQSTASCGATILAKRQRITIAPSGSTSKIFSHTGVLAELEKRRNALLFDIFSRLQAVARRFTVRRQMKKILKGPVAI